MYTRTQFLRSELTNISGYAVLLRSGSSAAMLHEAPFKSETLITKMDLDKPLVLDLDEPMVHGMLSATRPHGREQNKRQRPFFLRCAGMPCRIVICEGIYTYPPPGHRPVGECF